jgi:hypothetical protein
LEMVNRGRKMVIAMIVIVLLIDIITTASTCLIYAASGSYELVSSNLTPGIVRFIITALIMFYLYKGYGWAKWLSVILFLIGGLVSLFLIVSDFHVILLVLGLVYIFFGTMMIVSGSVNNFFRYQRGTFYS